MIGTHVDICDDRLSFSYSLLCISTPWNMEDSLTASSIKVVGKQCTFIRASLLSMCPALQEAHPLLLKDPVLRQTVVAFNGKYYITYDNELLELGFREFDGVSHWTFKIDGKTNTVTPKLPPQSLEETGGNLASFLLQNLSHLVQVRTEQVESLTSALSEERRMREIEADSKRLAKLQIEELNANMSLRFQALQSSQSDQVASLQARLSDALSTASSESKLKDDALAQQEAANARIWLLETVSRMRKDNVAKMAYDLALDAADVPTDDNLQTLKRIHLLGMLDADKLKKKPKQKVAHRAAASGNLKALEWLESVKMLDPREKGEHGRTIALNAAFNDHWNVVKWMQAKEIAGSSTDCDETDGRGWSLIGLAARSKNKDAHEWAKSVGGIPKQASRFAKWATSTLRVLLLILRILLSGLAIFVAGATAFKLAKLLNLF